MKLSSSTSFVRDVRDRELNGFRVRKRPHFETLESEYGGKGFGVMSIEHDGITTPPIAISFCKGINNCHLLGVSDEDGFVSLYDTRRKLSSFNSCRENPGDGRISEWIAHPDSIFDICWIKDDTQLFTASGDQTIKLWDVETRRCILTMRGHIGSVKSVCQHPSCSDLAVSGSRDGSLALWDLRCKPITRKRSQELNLMPISVVKEAHWSSQGKRVRRGKVSSTSITSVLYLNDEISIASSGAKDSSIKFWDTRCLKEPATQISPQLDSASEKDSGLHGISCLSQDSSGVSLAASCMNNRIYLYNVLQLERGPVKSFPGSNIGTFYVKSAISSDGAHILGGSSDENVHIWQVNQPESEPLRLKGHKGEVTAVTWCPGEIGKIATSSDDFTVRIWNNLRGGCSNERSPSRVRKRVAVMPRMENRNLVMDEPGPDPKTYTVKIIRSTEEASMETKMLGIKTPEPTERKTSLFLYEEKNFEMQSSPYSMSNSPSSVLNPPPSLKKKTIRDYFLQPS